MLYVHRNVSQAGEGAGGRREGDGEAGGREEGGGGGGGGRVMRRGARACPSGHGDFHKFSWSFVMVYLSRASKRWGGGGGGADLEKMSMCVCAFMLYALNF